MIHRVKKLSFWLNNNGFIKESGFVEDLIKESARKPLPINRAEAVDIVDELLAELGAKFLAHGVSPLDVLTVATGRMGVPRGTAEILFAETSRRKKDVSGRDISVKYMILFSDNPGLPPAQTSWREDRSEKSVILGFNPNAALQKAVSDYIQNNLAALRMAVGRPMQEFRVFSEAVRSYLLEGLRHEEVHVVDVMKKPEKFEGIYEISNPDGESLEEVSRKL